MRKQSDPVDVYVGKRVRARRMQVGMSQEKLGEALGLTFQQVQKYEKGANRISCSKLVAIARAVHAPVEFFFQGAPGLDGNAAAVEDPGASLTATRDGAALAKAFPCIADAKVRTRIVDLVEQLGAAA